MRREDWPAAPGFGAYARGALVPLAAEADHQYRQYRQYRTDLDDDLEFRGNRKE